MSLCVAQGVRAADIARFIFFRSDQARFKHRLDRYWGEDDYHVFKGFVLFPPSSMGGACVTMRSELHLSDNRTVYVFPPEPLRLSSYSVTDGCDNGWVVEGNTP